MVELTIFPRPGKMPSEIGMDADSHNALVRYTDRHGREITITPMTPSLRDLPNAKPAPEVYMVEEIRTPEGEIPIEKYVPEFQMGINVNPWHVLITSVVAEAGRIDETGIYRGLVHSYRVLPDTSKSWKAVLKMIDFLYRHAFLAHYLDEGKTYYVVGKPVTSTDQYLVRFFRGYDPVAYQIMKLLKDYNQCSRGFIENYICQILGWITNPKDLDDYLDMLEQGEMYGMRTCSQPGKGNLVRIRENYYQYQYPLEPWGERTV